ncbi:MAG: cytochrome c [Ignavibacteriaceae bacterium]|nr:cytochrome c [Ignavibacteriaceae bacterium]
MSKSIIWVGIFVAAFAGLLLLQHFTSDEYSGGGESGYGGMGGGASENTTQAGGGEELSGAQLFANFGCVNCHGAEMQGTKMGPSLAGVAKYYNREKLIAYLRNPEANMSGDRFDQYKKDFPGGLMPSYGNRDPKDLGKIADFILSSK